MNSEKLMDYIGQIDDRLIAQANVYPAGVAPTKRSWQKYIYIGVSAAACLVVAVSYLLNREQPTALNSFDHSSTGSNSAEATADYGAGFEGYLAFDIDELSNGNPWSANAVMDALPVFQNPVVYNDEGRPTGGLTADEMIEKAKQTAAALDLAVDTVFTNPTEEQLSLWRDKERSIPGNEGFDPDATPYEAEAVCGDVTIKVEPSGLIRIFFNGGVALPERYSLTFGNATEQQARQTVEYLLALYSPIVDMNAPAIDIFGDYNIYAGQSFSFSAYETGGDIVDQILGYNFNRVSFSPNDNGELWIIDRHSWDLSHKLGLYPIITAAEARTLLLQNDYITSVPEKLPGEEYIAHVELLYRTGRQETIFMPYYKFLVELPTMQRDNGLKTFGAFYVPAVQGEFLDSLSHGGGFN